jgi:hypothetical protein
MPSLRRRWPDGRPRRILSSRMPLKGRRSPVYRSNSILDLVELSGLEPLTSCMP